MKKAITLAALLLSTSAMASTSQSNQITEQSEARFLDEVSSQVAVTQITNIVTQLDEKQDYTLTQQRPTPELRSDDDGFAAIEFEITSLSE